MTKMKYTFVVDASFNFKSRQTGIGIVIHESTRLRRNGPIISHITETYNHISPGSGEEFAVLRALEIATERGYQVVKIRSDYNVMRKKLKKLFETGVFEDSHTMTGMILNLAKDLEEVKFSYVQRRKNQSAHRLAYLAAGNGKKSVNDFKWGSTV